MLKPSYNFWPSNSTAINNNTDCSETIKDTENICVDVFVVGVYAPGEQNTLLLNYRTRKQRLDTARGAGCGFFPFFRSENIFVICTDIGRDGIL